MSERFIENLFKDVAYIISVRAGINTVVLHDPGNFEISNILDGIRAFLEHIEPDNLIYHPTEPLPVAYPQLKVITASIEGREDLVARIKKLENNQNGSPRQIHIFGLNDRLDTNEIGKIFSQDYARNHLYFVDINGTMNALKGRYETT